MISIASRWDTITPLSEKALSPPIIPVKGAIATPAGDAAIITKPFHSSGSSMSR